jgi:hypothetical protein
MLFDVYPCRTKCIAFYTSKKVLEDNFLKKTNMKTDNFIIYTSESSAKSCNSATYEERTLQVCIAYLKFIVLFFLHRMSLPGNFFN